MTYLFHKSYSVKMTTNGGGGQKYPKIDHGRGLWMTPYKAFPFSVFCILFSIDTVCIF